MSGWIGTQRVWVAAPDEKDVPVHAYLDWQQGEQAQLRIDLVLGKRPKWLDTDRVERLLVLSPHPATLFNLLALNHTWGTSGEELTFRAEFALFDGSFEEGVPEFTHLEVTIEGCGLWFGIRGLREEETGSECIRITYEHVKTRTWPLNNGWLAEHSVKPSRQHTRWPTSSYKIEEVTELGLVSPKAHTVSDLMREFRKLQSFLEFACDESMYIEKVRVSQRGKTNEWVEVGAAWKQDKLKRSAGYRLFWWQAVEANFGAHLDRWYELYDLVPLALDMYRLTKISTSLPIEFRFLGIVSAIESLHRGLFDGEEPPKCERCRRRLGKSLEDRLRDLIDKYEHWIGDLMGNEDCKLIADTRNYLAHQTPALRAKAMPDDDLFFYYRRITMVFDIILLDQLPFAHDVREKIIKKR